MPRLDPLSLTLSALADPTRRAIVARLGTGEATVSQLAEPFDMSFPAISRHLKVLERAGLVEQGRDAQFRPRRLKAEPLRDLAAWLEDYRRHWDRSLDHLDAYLKDIQKRRKQMNAQLKADTRPELTIRRSFDAPRSLVFEMWTDGEHLKRWCCPTGFTIPFSEGDIRPGGRFRSCMRSPEGEDHWLGGTYVEIVPDEKIAFTHAWQDADGNAEHETLVTITLTEAAPGKTSLTLHQAFFLNTASRDGHLSGWQETLDQLERYLAR